MPISRLCHHLWTEPAFIFTVVTTGATEDFKLPLEATGTYAFQVVWGDGNVDNISAWDAAAKTHTYASAGTYVVVIYGTITGWRFNYDVTNRHKIYEVREWGPLRMGNNNSYFGGCSHLTVIAPDPLNLTGTTDMYKAFAHCLALDTFPNMDDWDVSSVTDMDSMFDSSDDFNQDIGSWDTSSCLDMHSMFKDAVTFNQDIGSWDVSNADLHGMFDGATAFNQDISSWDVTGSTSLSSMLASAAAFNQDISSWNVSSCTNMNSMFSYAAAFNQDIGSWNVSSCTTMTSTFRNATAFNQDISSWNVSIVTEMTYMFRGATAFNQNIGSWTTSSVTTMGYMFKDATAFNQNIGSWDTSSVASMHYMFDGATAFDQDLGSWDITALTNATGMFNGVTLSTANYDALLIGWEGQAVQNNVTFDGGNSKYSAGAAATARQALIDDHSWTITDGGQV